MDAKVMIEAAGESPRERQIRRVLHAQPLPLIGAVDRTRGRQMLAHADAPDPLEVDHRRVENAYRGSRAAEQFAVIYYRARPHPMAAEAYVPKGATLSDIWPGLTDAPIPTSACEATAYMPKDPPCPYPPRALALDRRRGWLTVCAVHAHSYLRAPGGLEVRWLDGYGPDVCGCGEARDFSRMCPSCGRTTH